MENENQSGVYLLINTVTGKEYVGSSKDLARRKKEHFNKLRLGKHPNIKIQRSCEKHGIEAFVFKVIAYCSMEDAFDLEQKWLNTHSPFYNICQKVEQPQTPTREVSKYSVNGDLIEKYPSLQEAALAVNGDRSSVAKACRGKLHTHKGFVWKYSDECASEKIESSTASIRNGMRWFEFWRSNDYTIYKWTKKGELVGTFSDIYKLSEELKLSVNYITSHFRGAKKSIYDHVYSLSSEMPRWD